MLTLIAGEGHTTPDINWLTSERRGGATTRPSKEPAYEVAIRPARQPLRAISSPEHAIPLYCGGETGGSGIIHHRKHFDWLAINELISVILWGPWNSKKFWGREFLVIFSYPWNSKFRNISPLLFPYDNLKAIWKCHGFVPPPWIQGILMFHKSVFSIWYT